MATDRDLIGQIRQGNTAAFEQIFDRYESTIHRHLVGIVRDDAAAQDLVQEVFLRVWTRAEQWHGSGTFKAWLYRIATNLALNALRSKRRRREEPWTHTDPWDEDEEEYTPPAWLLDAATPGADEVLEGAEQGVIVRRLVDRLPVEKREVFRLVHEMEMSIRDTAGELDLPEGTVKSRLYYARKHLAREWQDLNGE